MKAVVFHGIGDIRLDDVDEPRIEQPTDAIVRITASAICGTDLHMIRGTMPGMKAGTILGHEGVGVVEVLGDDVRNIAPGDRVVIPSTIACGNCSYCRAGYYAQCDGANPNGKQAGTAFFGGPELSGPFHGLQAEKARVPFAHVGLVKLPDEVSDEQALLLSDIFPTGYMAAEMCAPHEGSTVVVLGCGPVGQFSIASLKLLGAGRIFAVDCVDDRLEMARRQGAECIHFEREDPVDAVLRLTNGIGADRVIDAVGVDAHRAHAGPAAKVGTDKKARDEAELEAVAPGHNGHATGGDGKPVFVPGDAPSQALDWAVDMVAKAGTLAIIGVYPDTNRFFPIGKAALKNLTVRMGNCHHRKYIPRLVELVRAGVINPTAVLTQQRPLGGVIDAYEHFDRREQGWVKVELTA